MGQLRRLVARILRRHHRPPDPARHAGVEALKRSPLALDFYSWLTYEAFRAHKSGKGRFVAWTLLAKQMGTDYTNTDEFARKARVALRKVAALYPALKLGSMRGGVRIEPDSLPAITPRPSAAPPIHQAPVKRRPEGPPHALPDVWAALADQQHLVRESAAAFRESAAAFQEFTQQLINPSEGESLPDLTLPDGTALFIKWAESSSPAGEPHDRKAKLQQLCEALRRTLDVD